MSIGSRSKIEILNSNFHYASNIRGGPVIFILGNRINVFISDSNFYNNTSTEGGVFKSIQSSLIRCTRCNITNNFAVISGVSSMSGGADFELIDSDILNNYAYSIPIAEVSTSTNSSIVNGWRLSHNEILSKEFILNFLLNEGNLTVLIYRLHRFIF